VLYLGSDTVVSVEFALRVTYPILFKPPFIVLLRTSEISRVVAVIGFSVRKFALRCSTVIACQCL